MSRLIVLFKLRKIEGRHQSCRHLKKENLKVLASAVRVKQLKQIVDKVALLN